MRDAPKGADLSYTEIYAPLNPLERQIHEKTEENVYQGKIF